MVEKLIFKDGILQNESVGGVPVKLSIIERVGKGNCRTEIPLNWPPEGSTSHNTGNSRKGAGDEAHAKYFKNVEANDSRYACPHFCVDYDSFTQLLPINEVSYHASDGKGPGNYGTISIEICEDYLPDLAEYNSQLLNAGLKMTFGRTFKFYTHKDWSGKFCPHRILSRKDGWSNYVLGIEEIILASTAKKVDDAVPAIYKDSWDKAVLAGVEDGLDPNEKVTAAKLMAYLDKMGLLDMLIKFKEVTNGD